MLRVEGKYLIREVSPGQLSPSPLHPSSFFIEF
jgi:hypothetical protein